MEFPNPHEVNVTVYPPRPAGHHKAAEMPEGRWHYIVLGKPDAERNARKRLAPFQFTSLQGGWPDRRRRISEGAIGCVARGFEIALSTSRTSWRVRAA